MLCAGKWITAAFCSTFALSALAQVKVDDNFNQLIKPHTEISTLGPDLFGDKVSLYTGTTEFEVTDISVPGNNALPVSIGRRFVVEDRSKSVGAYPGLFGDWDLDIPHLHGVFAATAGWQVSTPGVPNARCSVPAQFTTSQGLINATPPNVNGTNSFPFSSAEYWSGNHLYVPGEGDKTMMVVEVGNGNLPNDGKSHPWITADNWTFSCLSATANGVPGEAFIATSPHGVQYTFDWFVSRPYKQLEKPSSVCTVPGPSCLSDLDRVEIWILPTSARDRFGNTVSYTYTNIKKACDASRSEQMARSFLESACYLSDLGEARQSISLLKRAASMGNVEAQVNLGVALAFGTGIKIDLEELRRWLKRAASQGSSYAAYNLGVIYRKHRELRWARHWFQRALELGDEDAQQDLDQITPMLSAASTSARRRTR